MYIHIYIYIYIEREREMAIRIQLAPVGALVRDLAIGRAADQQVLDLGQFYKILILLFNFKI